MKVIGLKIPDEVFCALNQYCAERGCSKQEWLETRLQDHFLLLMELTRVNEARERGKE